MGQRMTDGPEDGADLEVTDLRPAGERGRGAGQDSSRRVLLKRAWRWGALAVSLALLGALIVSALPAGGDLLRALQRLGRAATPTATVVSSVQIGAEIDQTSIPTTIIQTPPAPSLAAAPDSCAATAPTLTHVGPPHWGAAIGRAPVWLSNMSGTYPTLRLGSQASANAYGWDAPYTQFGWPAPIGLVLENGFQGPVRLTGWNVNTSEAVSFGFVQAGEWGAPRYISPDYTLNPVSGTIPAGGSDPSGVFWYGYAFVPRAGCYVIAASWPGGSWKATVSSGR
jgi:hypothetical protein